MLTNQAAGPGIFPQAVQAGERSAAPVSAAPPGGAIVSGHKTQKQKAQSSD